MEASLKALGVDAIGLYQFHRPDPKLPYAESIGAVKELLDEGKIRLAGISNATIDQIDIARKILGEQNLASVQNQLSPAFRSSEDELAHCAELGIAFLPYSPLGGISRAGDWGPGTPRSARSPTRTGFRPSRSPWPGCWLRPGGHPDPRRQPPRVHHRLRPGRRPHPHPRRTGPA